jgi:hypothetical protein
MTISDGLMIAATALSPLIAVQVSQYLAGRGEVRARKLEIFKVLMATRAQSISAAHVEALNRIDLEFSASSKKEKAVLDAWAQYLDHLGNTGLTPEAWGVRRVDLLVEVLYAMGLALGYGFNRTQIKNGIYAPVGHNRLETEQEQVRERVLEVLNGTRSLPMHITGVASPAAGSEQPNG